MAIRSVSEIIESISSGKSDLEGVQKEFSAIYDECIGKRKDLSQAPVLKVGPAAKKSKVRIAISVDDALNWGFSLTSTIHALRQFESIEVVYLWYAAVDTLAVKEGVSQKEMIDKLLKEHQVDGVVIPGNGHDIHPKLYDEELDGSKVNPDFPDRPTPRNSFEHALVSRCRDKGVPVLGLCGGHHILAIVAGGKIKQHMEGHKKPVPREGMLTPHRFTHVNISDASTVGGYLRQKLKLPRGIYGKEFYALVKAQSMPAAKAGGGDYEVVLDEASERVMVSYAANCCHHQVASPTKEFNKGMLVTGIDGEDGYIEIIESRSGSFYVSVQHHPEFNAAKDGVPRFYFLALVDAAESFQSKRLMLDEYKLADHLVRLKPTLDQGLFFSRNRNGDEGYISALSLLDADGVITGAKAS
jgi:gamma-glutamyl-gamma-aminobutyrate hydrolase PuuD